MIDISIVIVNFNTPRLLRDCLDSVLSARKATSKLQIETLVVNVTPSDGSGDFLAKDYNWVTQIKTSSNDGFAANNNKALPYIKGKHILFLNSDTKVNSNAISYVYDQMAKNPKVGAGTCKLELANGNLDPDCHRGFPTPWASLCHFTGLARFFPKSKLFGQYHLTFMDFEKEHEVDALAGAFMMIPKEVGKRVGFWDEDFFFYGEDIDFCYRIKQGGYQIMYYPQVKITHFKGASSGLRSESQRVTTASNETRQKLAAASVDAMKIFYKKHWMEEYPGWVTGLVFVGIELLKLFRMFKFRLAKKRL
ncbi:MAG: glycosyltransferase family 2 protein [bacterium]